MSESPSIYSPMTGGAALSLSAVLASEVEPLGTAIGEGEGVVLDGVELLDGAASAINAAVVMSGGLEAAVAAASGLVVAANRVAVRRGVWVVCDRSCVCGVCLRDCLLCYCCCWCTVYCCGVRGECCTETLVCVRRS